MQKTFQPFAPVELQTLLTPDGQSTGRKAVVLDPTGEAQQVGYDF